MIPVIPAVKTSWIVGFTPSYPTPTSAAVPTVNTHMVDTTPTFISLSLLRGYLSAHCHPTAFYTRSTPALPPLYPRSTPALPPLYPRSTPALPPLYPRSTPALPPLYPRSTPALPPLYPRSTSSPI